MMLLVHHHNKIIHVRTPFKVRFKVGYLHHIIKENKHEVALLDNNTHGKCPCFRA